MGSLSDGMEANPRRSMFGTDFFVYLRTQFREGTITLPVRPDTGARNVIERAMFAACMNREYPQVQRYVRFKDGYGTVHVDSFDDMLSGAINSRVIIGNTNVLTYKMRLEDAEKAVERKEARDIHEELREYTQDVARLINQTITPHEYTRRYIDYT